MGQNWPALLSQNSIAEPATYQAGRGHGWIKLKCLGREELIIVGWTPPSGSRTGIGALHLGYFDPKGGLNYAGAVGTGFSDKVLTDLRRRLEPLKSEPPTNLLVAGDHLDSSIQWGQAGIGAGGRIYFLVWERPCAPRRLSRPAGG